MLDVLGLDPADPTWGPQVHGDDKAMYAVDVLVRGLLEARAAARVAKDWARADEIRDQLKAAGVEVEDTPDGPKWNLGGMS
jgi:cysteinyl-tRNA synthetase